MDFTFVVNGEPENRKRKTVQGACDRCKRRKKRCTHHPSQYLAEHSESRSPQGALSVEENHASTQSFLGSSTTEGPHKEVEGGPHVASPRSRHTSTPPPPTRFVGDLNPEASMIAEAQSERAPRRDRNRIGIWLDHENNQSRRASVAADQMRRPNDPHDIPQPGSTYTIGASPHAEMLLPDSVSQQALLDLYFLRFHPILPILDEDQTKRDFATGSISHILLQAVYLVISKDFRARPYLYLTSLSSSILTPSQFASHLYEEVRIAVLSRRERDRVCLIQILALLSLHTERGPFGVEDSSMHLAQAIHHAHTIGLHLGISRSHRQSYDRLFWCLWCLSTLNAASNGRPRLISEDDIGLRVDDVLDSCHPAFQIMIALSRLLARVIRLYQPAADTEVTGIDTSFPTFEVIVLKSNGWDLDPFMLTSLELYYHAISILSYRARSTDDMELPERSASSLRQALSAQQVMGILQHTPLQALLPLPTVPYAVSLALSQTYRQFRRSRSSVRRAITQEQLERYVQTLDDLSDRFQSAHTMAVIGHKILKQIQRLHNTAARQAAGTSHAHEVDPMNHRKAYGRPITGSAVDHASMPFAAGQNDSGQVYGHMDSFGEFDNLFTGDGTLQAIDSVFDNFMGLDLPNNDLFNASLEIDSFGMAGDR